jgi:signal peptidase I
MKLRRWILIAVLCGTLIGCNNNWSSGDRVLVSRCAYGSGLTEPHRYDVVVFKFPGNKDGSGGPVKNATPTNYIKRLLGLPGELLAIFFGRVYRWTPPDGAQPPFDDLKDGKVQANDLWRHSHMHFDDPESQKWFNEGQFEILRKPPQVMLAMRRIVYDNDFQAKDMKNFPRWKPNAESGWKADGPTGFAHDGPDGPVDWIHYQHLVRKEPVDAERMLIIDSMAYNNFKNPMEHAQYQHWVGDLMLECDVDVVQPKGELWLELNKGIFRFQARFDLATGQCNLKRIAMDGKETDMGSHETALKGTGHHSLRFANIDARLTVWVDRTLPFGDGVAYPPPEIRARGETISDEDLIKQRRGPTKNDLKPASIGSKGASAKINHIRLWRDTYYTTAVPAVDRGPDYSPPKSWSDPAPDDWDSIKRARFTTMYVQPGHYLCLGDNSQASSDSRDWGTVPERLMLGRALVVYFPLDRIGFIR